MKSTAILFALVLACSGQVIITPTTANKEDFATEAKSIEIIGKYSGEWRRWMWIGRVNTTDKPEQGFHPSMTYIVSDYKPIAKRLSDGHWLIQFTSELAENIP
jgi:hypothetical protein